MYTETELRELLRASADRVGTDDSMPASRPSPDEPMIAEIGSRPTRNRRRILAPIAVAASTAAVIAGVVALTQHSRSGHPAPAGGARSTATRAPAHLRTTHAAPRPRPTLTVPVVDDVRIDTRNSTENYVGKVDGGHGQQVITSQLAHDRSINLVIAPGFAFNDRNVSTAHPVAIAGTTGHYAVLRLFPLTADGNGGSAPTGTIVFRTPDRHWAFAWLQAGTKNGNAQGTPVDDPAAIVRGFDTLHAHFSAGTTRTPLRVGYLPAGAQFDDADVDAAHSRLVVASITALSGDKQMDISLLNLKDELGGGADTDGTTCFKTIGCTVRRHRDLPGGFELSVNGTKYSAAETQKVLDHVSVAADPNDPSTYFLLTHAVG